jgi:hypothetical protein
VSLRELFDGRSDSIKLIAQAPEKFPTEESEIVQFVRTPEGSGVGVIRQRRVGEVWQLGQESSTLNYSGSWNAADHLLVLDHGMFNIQNSLRVLTGSVIGQVDSLNLTVIRTQL